jgi:hypothetical protein
MHAAVAGSLGRGSNAVSLERACREQSPAWPPPAAQPRAPWGRPPAAGQGAPAAGARTRALKRLAGAYDTCGR